MFLLNGYFNSDNIFFKLLRIEKILISSKNFLVPWSEKETPKPDDHESSLKNYKNPNMYEYHI